MLECPARKLNVVKNTKKNDRVEILSAWNASKGGVKILVQRQRKRSKGDNGEEDKRTKTCMFTLPNVLFSDRFYEAYLATGNQLFGEEIDRGGLTPTRLFLG
ncbi:unnamed protein product [Phytophthora fragariaefolia]|uniref:Unnamed protein product n=1 Tax=Phytophthora fragariaefolia TaxID=1490495 RepID=A0A9W7D513_9STRA|nr:unnamed protein product [Phytophthora fragariaefolia]